MSITGRDFAMFGLGILGSSLLIALYGALQAAATWDIKRIVVKNFVWDAISRDLSVTIDQSSCAKESVDLADEKDGIAWNFKCTSKTSEDREIVVYYHLTKSGAVVYSEGWN